MSSQQTMQVDEWSLLQSLSQQFAEEYAFIRELIQNSRDAGSGLIEVSVVVEPQPFSFHHYVEVKDYGEGMSKADFRDRAMRLFNSEKEKDLQKAGQFGVGLASIWSINPDYVIFDTAKDGDAYRYRWVNGKKTFSVESLDDLIEGTTIRVGKVESYDSLLSAQDESMGYPCGSPEEAEQHLLAVADLIETFPASLNKVTLAAIKKYCRYLDVPIYYSFNYSEPELVTEPLFLPEKVAIGINLPSSTKLPNYKGKGLSFEAVLAISEQPYSLILVKNIILEECQSLASPAFNDHTALLVNSSHFRFTISRNGIRRDKNYEKVLKGAEAFLPELYEHFVTHLAHEFSTGGSAVNQLNYLATYLRQGTKTKSLRFLRAHAKKRLTKTGRTTPCIPTYDGHLLSVDDVLNYALAEKTVYCFKSKEEHGLPEGFDMLSFSKALLKKGMYVFDASVFNNFFLELFQNSVVMGFCHKLNNVGSSYPSVFPNYLNQCSRSIVDVPYVYAHFVEDAVSHQPIVEDVLHNLRQTLKLPYRALRFGAISSGDVIEMPIGQQIVAKNHKKFLRSRKQYELWIDPRSDFFTNVSYIAREEFPLATGLVARHLVDKELLSHSESLPVLDRAVNQCTLLSTLQGDSQ